jgi:uncharacterized protein RhaS with RHS repeats
MGRLSLALAMSVVLAAAVPAEAGTISYTYDQLGRLSQVAYPNGAIIRYLYDANGNRTSYVVTGSANPPPAGTTPVGQAQIVQQTAQVKTIQPTATSPPH